MTTVPLSRITAALDAQGLLAGTQGVLPDEVSGIRDDSRMVSLGDVFVAVRGSAMDGHQFLPHAAEQGAAVAIVDTPNAADLPSLIVRDSRRAAAVAAAAFYGEPARSLRLVAVTGTNGKTTTVGILRHLLDAPEHPSASIGTLGVLRGSAGREVPGSGGLTTPGPVELQRTLRALVDDGVVSVAMEVSSHSLAQARVDGVSFQAAVFTNLSRDHLDYHGTMQRYLDAKLSLAGLLAPDGAAVVNADDDAWTAVTARGRRVTFGLAAPADVTAKDITFAETGSAWTLAVQGERHQVRLPLMGDFNISNALGAAAAAWTLGAAPRALARMLADVPQVPGRLERILVRPAVLRDYAHTPDALERALRAVRPFTRERVILVFGCGGDRDPGKRPLMGAIAMQLADRVIVTSDNPRTEDPERILDQITAGLPPGRYERMEDRRDAIGRALDMAQDGDVVLLAGKGHETYQIRGTTRLPFDEKVIVRQLAGISAA